MKKKYAELDQQLLDFLKIIFVREVFYPRPPEGFFFCNTTSGEEFLQTSLDFL